VLNNVPQNNAYRFIIKQFHYRAWSCQRGYLFTPKLLGIFIHIHTVFIHSTILQYQ